MSDFTEPTGKLCHTQNKFLGNITNTVYVTSSTDTGDFLHIVTCYITCARPTEDA